MKTFPLAFLVWLAPLPAIASGVDPWDGDWHTQLSVYGWLPGISATMRHRLPDGVTIENRSQGDLLSKLSGAFMMDVTARKGRWAFTPTWTG